MTVNADVERKVHNFVLHLPHVWAGDEMRPSQLTNNAYPLQGVW